jgi:hypothetical protein
MAGTRPASISARSEGLGAVTAPIRLGIDRNGGREPMAVAGELIECRRRIRAGQACHGQTVGITAANRPVIRVGRDACESGRIELNLSFCRP